MPRISEKLVETFSHPYRVGFTGLGFRVRWDYISQRGY